MTAVTMTTVHIARFRGKVAVTDDPSACWEWIGKRRSDGYGLVQIARKEYRAHRISWMIANGPIPEGMEIRHTCDNKPCVNPAHLLVGTHADNMRDAAERKLMRWPGVYGERIGNSKLTAENVLEMRQLHAEGWTNRALAGRYNVSRRAIQFVLSGRNWIRTV